MLQKKDPDSTKPLAVSVLRIVHVLLALHASAIIGITFSLQEDAGFFLTPERIFSLAVALPMLLGSVFCWLAATTRRFFGTAIFLCTLLMLIFAGLPIMMNIFFPMHLVIFALSAIYALSILILGRYCFSQPLPKK